MGFGMNVYKSLNHPLRSLFLNAYALSLNLERYGKKFQHLLEEFFRNEKMTSGEIREYQREKLTALIRHAYIHVPYYRETMNALKLKPDDIKDIHDLPKLPLLTREDVKANYHRLKADNIPRHRVRHGHTSGTTGSPLEFLWDIDVCVAHHAADWRQKKWAGLEFGEPFISLQGRQIVPPEQTNPPFWVMNRIHNQLFMSSFHLKDEYLPHYVSKIASFRPRAIEGYPSSLYILARYMERHGITISVPAVLTSSETLLPLQRELIEERFQCRVYDFYGMAERVVYGSECNRHSGKHLNMDYGLTEIVGSDDLPVSPGGSGRIVATGLWNLAMPLIRYKTSDVSRIDLEGCACGRSFPLMDHVTTKAEDIIVLKDGRLVPPSIMTHPFKPLKNIVLSQIVQEDYTEFSVYLAVNEHFTAGERQQLYQGLQERLGSDAMINIVISDQLGKGTSGKFRWIISRVSPC